MSGYDNLNKRLQYRGGVSNNRLEKDKAYSLKKALWDSYQSETIILNDNREFKCLINPDKQKPDYDNKIISIPYQDQCLNSNSKEEVEIGLKPGDVFTWKENSSHWLVYLKALEESAYFRAEIRKCTNQAEINKNNYWVYLRGPVETAIKWNQKAGTAWNTLNHSMVMFITKNDETMDYLHRFSKIKITEPNLKEKKTWKVVGTNKYYGDGIIQVFLDEAFENTIEDAVKEKETEEDKKPVTPLDRYIKGPSEVLTFDTVTYEAIGFSENGKWSIIENQKEKILDNQNNKITFNITKIKGTFIIKYKTDTESAQLQVVIKPL